MNDGFTAYVIVSDTDFVLDSAAPAFACNDLHRLYFIDSYGTYTIKDRFKLMLLGAAYDVSFGDPANGPYRLFTTPRTLFEHLPNFNTVIYFFTVLFFQSTFC